MVARPQRGKNSFMELGDCEKIRLPHHLSEFFNLLSKNVSTAKDKWHMSISPSSLVGKASCQAISIRTFYFPASSCCSSMLEAYFCSIFSVFKLQKHHLCEKVAAAVMNFKEVGKHLEESKKCVIDFERAVTKKDANLKWND